MGLDMWLYRHTAMPYSGLGNEVTVEIIIRINGKRIKHGISPDNTSQIVEKVGYWRKANAIHDWFVQNVQDGEDDCGYYDVSIKQLEELQQLCEEVIANPELAPDLLPTRAGFFYGSMQYDDWYFEGLKSTVEIIKEIMTHSADENLAYWYVYTSSW